MTAFIPSRGSILSMIPAEGKVTFTCDTETWTERVVALAVVAGASERAYDDAAATWITDSFVQPVVLDDGTPMSVTQYLMDMSGPVAWKWTRA